MNNKKIGLLTFHDTTNFGAALQTAALYKSIEENGKRIEIINYHCPEIDRREIPKYQYASSNNKIKWLIKYFLYGYKYARKHHALLKFLQRETVISTKSYHKENICLSNEEYDCFIVGSDMLWNTKYTLSDYTFMLDFVKNNKTKYAFATSGMYGTYDEGAVIENLSRFDRISVREEELANKLSILLNRKIDYVCDPTMLIEPAAWKNYLTNKYKQKEYCLMYFDDAMGNVSKSIKNYSQQNGITAKNIDFSILGRSRTGLKSLEVYTIEDFLTAIANAKVLFTASYHGMLFAIYFHVPFVYYNKDSYRLEAVAQKLGLEGRNGNKYDIQQMSDIDWEQVDTKREIFRNHSKKILRAILES